MLCDWLFYLKAAASIRLPLPLGEGRGEGLRRAWPLTPNRLPKREGEKYKRCIVESAHSNI